MAHSGEPVGDAGLLFGDLLEDPGPSVADDVVVALHDADLAYIVPHGAREDDYGKFPRTSAGAAVR